MPGTGRLTLGPEAERAIRKFEAEQAALREATARFNANLERYRAEDEARREQQEESRRRKEMWLQEERQKYESEGKAAPCGCEHCYDYRRWGFMQVNAEDEWVQPRCLNLPLPS